MAIYTPNITVNVNNKSILSYDIQIEAPSFDGLLSDLEHICKELLAAHIQQFVDYSDTEFPVFCTIIYDVLSIRKRFEHTMDRKEFENLKSLSSAEKMNLKLDVASLQNDIQYGIDMIRSIADITKDVAMLGVVNWQYHILNKHFGLAIPQSIINLVDKLGEKNV